MAMLGVRRDHVTRSVSNVRRRARRSWSEALSAAAWPAPRARSTVRAWKSPIAAPRPARPTPAHLYFNKYIDGVPHLCEALEISMTGMLVRRLHEPERDLACYAVELAPEPDTRDAVATDGDRPEPAERVWLCASPVWSH